MRTGCWLAIVCLLFLYGTQAAFGLQSSASDDLNITVSGVMVGDAQYEVFLEMGSSTASPCNWVYQSIQPVVASEQLPYVDGELNLVIPSLSYQGENYLLKLAFAADGQALPAMHWALTDMVEVAQSADLLSTQVLSSESDKQTLVRGINGFGLELFKQLAGSTEYENGNFLFSPFEISRSMALIYAGAANQTAGQMASVLQYNLSREQLHPAFNALTLDLSGHGGAVETQTGQETPVFDTGYRITVASMVWMANSTLYTTLLGAVNQTFIDLLAYYYGLGIYGIPRLDSSQAIQDAMNRQIARKTNDQFQNLVPEGAVTSGTKLFLSDGIFLQASWLLPFDRGYTDYDYFHNGDGSQNFASFMYQENEFNYFSGTNYQAVELFYSGKNLSMLLILPDESQSATVEAMLGPQMLDTILAGFEEKSLRLRLPKWDFTNGVDLAPPLAQMGMTDLFSNVDADLTQMADNLASGMDDFIHGAYIIVDENGTKAGAHQEPFNTGALDIIDVTFDRPFIYLLRDTAADTILLMGRLAASTDS